MQFHIVVEEQTYYRTHCSEADAGYELSEPKKPCPRGLLETVQRFGEKTDCIKDTRTHETIGLLHIYLFRELVGQTSI